MALHGHGLDRRADTRAHMWESASQTDQPGSVTTAPLSCRAGMVEYHRRALMGLTALHGANAPISAARLLDRCQAHVLEALAWTLDAPPPPAVHAYAAILWHCTPLLLPRLDISQRMALCQVPCSAAPTHFVPCSHHVAEHTPSGAVQGPAAPGQHLQGRHLTHARVPPSRWRCLKGLGQGECGAARCGPLRRPGTLL